MEATLELVPDSAPISPRSRWIGRALSGVPVAFLLFDAGVKIVGHPAVEEASARLGLPRGLGPTLAALELVCLALYLVPRTAVIGAVMLSGYLGGAIAIHLRIGDPLFSHTLFPVYVAAMFWGGLYLRDARVRALVAPKK